MAKSIGTTTATASCSMIGKREMSTPPTRNEITSGTNATLPRPMSTSAVVEMTVSPPASSVITGVTSSGVMVPSTTNPIVSSGDKSRLRAML